ncbi:unnamed protein product [Alternaria alternata]
MARQSSDANSMQPSSHLVPRQDVQSSEPSRPQPPRSGINRDRAKIKLKKLTFYDEDGESSLYSVDDMPYDPSHEKIGEGAYAKVYKTTIKGDSYDAGQGFISTEYQVARKEFSGLRARDNFLIENKICRDFYKANSGINKTIVAPLFSYAVEDSKGGVNYNICYELATCDLQTYLSDDKNFPRGKSRKRIAHIEQMLRVAEGLKWLMKTTTKEGGLFRALGITHCDLHWRNILLCEDENHPGSLIFKIGDFGSARNGRDSENKQRSGVAWAERINGQFSAPEPEAHENGDVWSFGCNLLLVLVFNYYGVGGKNEFLASLLRHSSQDWFYDQTTGAASHETTSCMDHLRRCFEHDVDGLVTVELLDVLQQSVLVPLKARMSISQVVKALRACLEKQKTLLLYELPQNAGDPIAREYISLTDLKDVSRVALAPNAKYIAIDADCTLRLYERQQLLDSMKLTGKLSRNRTIPYGLSQLGVSGCEFDLLRSAARFRSCAEQSVVLRFSPNNQFLYHAYRTESSKHRGSYDCLITVDLWCTTKRSHLGSVAVEKQDVQTPDFLIDLAPFNDRQAFLVVTCYSHLTRYTFGENEARCRLHTINIQDNIQAVLISPDDDYAVLLGQKNNLSVHVVNLQQGLGEPKQLGLLESSIPRDVFDRHRDAASIVDRETLLISYHNGPSVHITLTLALDIYLERKGHEIQQDAKKEQRYRKLEQRNGADGSCSTQPELLHKI